MFHVYQTFKKSFICAKLSLFINCADKIAKACILKYSVLGGF